MLENQHEGAPLPSSLSRRERQVMQILASSTGGATAAEVQAAMEAPPGYSAIRALLRVMEEKGLITHRQDGPRYVFEPIAPQTNVRKSALREVLAGFFNGSRAALVEALFDPADGKIPAEEVDRLAKLIKEARKQGR
jgi:predicted transcriptional regulator